MGGNGAPGTQKPLVLGRPILAGGALVLDTDMGSPGRVAQWVGVSSCAPKGRRFRLQSGRVWEATDQCFSLFLSLKSNIPSGEDERNRRG